jgi:RNA polymerase sigma-70 factor (ECF subfamily)
MKVASRSALLLALAPDREALSQLPDLDALIDSHFAAARAAWPAIRISDERFLRHLAERATGRGADGFARLSAADLYLACACVDGDADAIRELEAHLFGAIEQAVKTIGGSRAIVDDVKQTLREQLFTGADRSRLASYAGAGSLRSWLRSVALRTAIRLMRPDLRMVSLEDAFLDFASTGTPELLHMKQTYRQEFAEALRLAVRALSVRQRNLLRQHFIDGLSIDRLGALHGVHRATAARWLAAARSDLINTARETLRARLQATDSELQSIARLVLSQLELGLAQVSDVGAGPRARS